ncbi:MAG: type I 3-dehydroquinate dehydratase [Pseudomonadota bacterium]
MIALSLTTTADLNKPETKLADIIELRLDLMNLNNFSLYSFPVLYKMPIIYTLRSTSQGGKFKFDKKQFIEIILKLKPRKTDYIDIELNKNYNSIIKVLRAKNINSKILLSSHSKILDLNHTPNLNKETASQISALKFIYQGKNSTDNFKVLANIKKLKNKYKKNIISFCMGETSNISRILCLSYGSKWTYASINQEKKTAQGQVDIKKLTDIYSIKRLKPKAKLYGLIGNPVEQSLGYVLFNYLFHKYGINGIYVPILVKSSLEFRDLIDRIKNLELRFFGLSITTPYKKLIINYFKSTNFESVNTVSVKNKNVFCDNTDNYALECFLKKIKDLSKKKIAILGAGAVASSFVKALNNRSLEITLFNRTLEKAKLLEKRYNILVKPLFDIKAHDFDILINCTSVGIIYKGFPFSLPALNNKIIIELNYRPIETPLIKLAKKGKNNIIFDGLDFFIYQGLKQFELFTGHKVRYTKQIRKMLCKY